MYMYKDLNTRMSNISLESLKLHQNYDISHHYVADDCKVGRVHVKHVQRPNWRPRRKAFNKELEFPSLLHTDAIEQEEFFHSVLYLEVNLTQALSDSCVGVELDHVEDYYEKASDA